MSRRDAEQLALTHSESGLHCAESVASAITHLFSPEQTKLACRMATGFGGGMGGCRQEACGALTGGILTIGLLCGRMSPEQRREPADQLTTLYRDRFIARFGNSVCQTLRDNFDTNDTKAACRNLTAEAAGILHDILQEHGYTETP